MDYLNHVQLCELPHNGLKMVTSAQYIFDSFWAGWDHEWLVKKMKSVVVYY
jgi:hypothetical protein